MHKLPDRLRKEKSPDLSAANTTQGMELVCDGCGVVLTSPGGLVFGIPNEHGMSRKYHLCSTSDNGCFAEIKLQMSALRTQPHIKGTYDNALTVNEVSKSCRSQ